MHGSYVSNSIIYKFSYCYNNSPVDVSSPEVAVTTTPNASLVDHMISSKTHSSVYVFVCSPSPAITPTSLTIGTAYNMGETIFARMSMVVDYYIGIANRQGQPLCTSCYTQWKYTLNMT